MRLPASVDDGALVGIMCATKYNEVAHRLGALRPSFKKFRMANGTLVPSRGSWEGTMTFGPAKAKVAFEVFASSGDWSFLFGKPLLEQFQAVHDYVDDTISVPSPNGHVKLGNRVADSGWWRTSKDRVPKKPMVTCANSMGDSHSPLREVQPSIPAEDIHHTDILFNEDTEDLTSKNLDNMADEQAAEGEDSSGDIEGGADEVIDAGRSNTVRLDRHVNLPGDSPSPSREVHCHKQDLENAPDTNDHLRSSMRTDGIKLCPKFQALAAAIKVTVGLDCRICTDGAKEGGSIEECADKLPTNKNKHDATHEDSVGDLSSPLRGVLRINPDMDSLAADTNCTECVEPAVNCLNVEDGDNAEVGDVQPEIDPYADKSLFTQETDPYNMCHVRAILDEITIGDDLTGDQRQTVVDFVTEFADCFALSMSEIRSVPDATHKIDIPKDHVFNTKVQQCLLTPIQGVWYNKVIDKMLKLKIIAPIHPKDVKCISPTTLAQKAHQDGNALSLDELKHRVNDQCIAAGLPPLHDMPERPVPKEMDTTLLKTMPAWCVCHNFWELNKMMKVALMPQGDIHYKQGLLSGHRWIMVFDFAKGFHACKMDESICPYLCFYVEGRGLFTYLKMPFGLTGSPAIFANTTRNSLGNLVGSTVQLFVDNGGLAESDFEKKMSNLQTVFTCIREKRLSVSAKKMQFFMTEATFTGRRIGLQGIQPDLAKLMVIVGWEKPKTMLNLKSFLGLARYFRKLIPNYAKIAKPLSDLEKKADISRVKTKAEWR